MLALCAAHTSWSGEPPAPDDWIAGPVQYPSPFDRGNVIRLHSPGLGLRAEALAGKIRVMYDPSAGAQAGARASAPAAPASPTGLALYASTDAPGHWPARDWHAWSMRRRGALWQTWLPVEQPEVPVVYFAVLTNQPIKSPRRSAPRGAVQDVASRRLFLTPMRRFLPRPAGLSQPTHVFSPFLEGFEAGLTSWRLLSDPSAVPAPTLDPEAHSGAAALCIRVPAGQRSVTVATTRLRSWHIRYYDAVGLRLWMRTRHGSGRVRVSFLAQALTSRQTVAVYPEEPTLHEQWQRLEVWFRRCPGLPWPDLDLLAIQCMARGPCEFLLDDLELVRRWSLAEP